MEKAFIIDEKSLIKIDYESMYINDSMQIGKMEFTNTYELLEKIIFKKY